MHRMTSHTDCSEKDAIKALSRRLQDKSPSVVMRTLVLLEMIVKNCGSVVHKEIATDEFMAVLRTLVRVR